MVGLNLLIKVYFFDFLLICWGSGVMVMGDNFKLFFFFGILFWFFLVYFLNNMGLYILRK